MVAELYLYLQACFHRLRAAVYSFVYSKLKVTVKVNSISCCRWFFPAKKVFRMGNPSCSISLLEGPRMKIEDLNCCCNPDVFYPSSRKFPQQDGDSNCCSNPGDPFPCCKKVSLEPKSSLSLLQESPTGTLKSPFLVARKSHWNPKVPPPCCKKVPLEP
jgi:hypothetical protein